MYYDDIRSGAEQTARKMTSFLFIVSLIFCFVLAGAGIYFLANSEEADNIIGYALLFLSVISIFWTILYWALVDIFINISVKLNPLQEILWKFERIESDLNKLTHNRE